MLYYIKYITQIIYTYFKIFCMLNTQLFHCKIFIAPQNIRIWFGSDAIHTCPEFGCSDIISQNKNISMHWERNFQKLIFFCPDTIFFWNPSGLRSVWMDFNSVSVCMYMGTCWKGELRKERVLSGESCDNGLLFKPVVNIKTKN